MRGRCNGQQVHAWDLSSGCACILSETENEVIGESEEKVLEFRGERRSMKEASRKPDDQREIV